MKQYLTWPKSLSAATLATFLALGLLNNGAVAGSSSDDGKAQFARSSIHAVPLHRRHLTQRELHPGLHASSPYGEFTPRTFAYVGARYIHVPKPEILDEACNLPTSACPNTQRDGQ
jgi:hypothetical protein